MLYRKFQIVLFFLLFMLLAAIASLGFPNILIILFGVLGVILILNIAREKVEIKFSGFLKTFNSIEIMHRFKKFNGYNPKEKGLILMGSVYILFVLGSLYRYKQSSASLRSAYNKCIRRSSEVECRIRVHESAEDMGLKNGFHNSVFYLIFPFDSED